MARIITVIIALLCVIFGLLTLALAQEPVTQEVPPAVDAGGVSLSVPRGSLPPGRSTSGTAVVPPSKTNEGIDELLCEKYGDCAALKKRQKKNREKGNK